MLVLVLVMKKLLLLAAVAPAFAAVAQDGILDLTRLPDYAGQEVPGYIQRDNTPPGNPITNLGATLGRVLFYDKRLSRDDTIACASCHQQEHAFSDLAAASAGVAGTTGRHSMRLVNARFGEEARFFWDERAVSLEDQTTRPIQDHVEMGFSGADGDPGFSDLVSKLAIIREYQALFAMVYGDPAIDEPRVQHAIAQFVRSIQSFDSRYDQGRAQVQRNNEDFPNFTAQENRGKQLFQSAPRNGGAGCAGCHRPPEFDIDPDSGNNGVIGTLPGGTDLTVTRSPSLRDLVDPSGAPNGAFMHDASLGTLLDVINHYNSIPVENAGLDNRLRGGPGPQGAQLNLSEAQKGDLVAFLRTLTGSSIYTDARWSDPFDESGNLELIVLPAGSVSVDFSGVGESRIATVAATGVPGLEYSCEASSDLVNWTGHSVTADQSGALSSTLSAPASTAHRFFRYVYRVPE